MLLPNFVLPMLYFALPILNIELPELHIVLPTLYFIFPEHNIRLPMIDIDMLRSNFDIIINQKIWFLIFQQYFYHFLLSISY